MMSRLIVLFFGYALTINPTYANDIVKQGASNLNGSSFIYRIIETGSGKRRIEVVHKEKKYDGVLGSLTFRDRHLKIFKMVAGLIKESCSGGVGSLGNIAISKDPEQDEDPLKMHPQFFNWEYRCK